VQQQEEEKKEPARGVRRAHRSLVSEAIKPEEI